MKYVLYNELCNNNKGKVAAENYVKNLNEEFELCNVQGMNYVTFLDKLSENDEVVLVGGDGTLNRFINDIIGYDLNNKVYLYGAGSGNDFLRDVAEGKDMVCINDYIKNLPTVYVNGMKRKFINGIGYGIDGYCCEVGDKMRAEGNSDKINYTSIAIKGLLFKFKKVNATITVDGVKYEHKHVWLAPTMKGRYYGGGMLITPEQNRLDIDGILTAVIFKGRSKLATLMAFPDIFKGKLGKHKKRVAYYPGHEIEVSFDRPTALQIDGETVLNVTSYRVVSHD